MARLRERDKEDIDAVLTKLSSVNRKGARDPSTEGHKLGPDVSLIRNVAQCVANICI